jgi:hypothetical protein
MQVKPSYRALKWSLLLVGIAASLGACVVTEGNGDDDDAFGGDSGTSTAGTKSTAGSDSGTAGTKTTGGSGGTAGTSAGGSPEGGSADAYVPGLCEADSPTPTVEPSCAPVAADDTAGHECAKCVKAKCCNEWQTCFGNTPTTACGFGATADADGQFECILNCFGDNKDGETDADTLLGNCTAGCANQCDTPDNGLPLDSTNALVDCANKAATCQAECFPF